MKLFINLMRKWKQEDGVQVIGIWGMFIILMVASNLFGAITPGLIINMLIEKRSFVFIVTILVINGVVSYFANYFRNRFDRSLFLFRLGQIGKVQGKCIECPASQIEREDGKEKIERVMDSVASGNDFGIEAYLKESTMLLYSILQIMVCGLILQSLSIRMILITLILIIIRLPYEQKYQSLQVINITETRSLKQKLEEFRRCILSENFMRDVRIRNGIEYTAAELKQRTVKISEKNEWRRKSRSRRFIFNQVLLFVNVFSFILLERQSTTFVAGNIVIFMGIISEVNRQVDGLLERLCRIRENQGVSGEYEKFMREGTSDKKDSIIISTNKRKPLIQMHDVSFSYGGEPIIKKLNLEINSGDKIAVVGENGIGKTTLIKLLLGVLRPSEGYVEREGEITIENYANIAACLQQSPLLPFSVVENIACKPEHEADKREVLKVAEKVGIENMVFNVDGESPYCTDEYYDNGINFSGGEKQRIYIARMLYKNADIQLLDEPTASLDALEEYRIYKMCEELSADKACIFVSHRLNTTRFCNKILFMEKADKYVLNDFETLYRTNAEFKRMYDMQMEKYMEEGGEYA